MADTNDTPTRRARAMGAHESQRALTTTWLTPRHIIDALGPFDLDPCAAPGWHTASRGIILPEDGLAAQWEGRIWLNPPYNKAAWLWLDKLSRHSDGGTALIFARTETVGFVEQVWSKATALLFLHGRLNFHHADGTRATANAGAPSVLVAYGEHDADIMRSAPLAGTFIPLARNEGVA